MLLEIGARRGNKETAVQINQLIQHLPVALIASTCIRDYLCKQFRDARPRDSDTLSHLHDRILL